MNQPPNGQRSEAATRRIRALVAWRGPWSMTLRSDSGSLHRGWQVLSLGVRTARTHRIAVESRSIYANLADERQTTAVLRAVYWNQASASEFDTSHNHSQSDISARFVRVSAKQTQSWIASLFGQCVPMIEPWHEGDGAPIRSLKIDLNWISHTFDKSWQSASEDHAGLNQSWMQLWEELGVLLRSNERIEDLSSIEESFLHTDDIHDYDIGEYNTRNNFD